MTHCSKESKLTNLEQFIGQTLPLIFNESVFVISAIVDQMLNISPNVSQGVNPLSIIPAELLSEEEKKRYMHFARQQLTAGRDSLTNTTMPTNVAHHSVAEHETEHGYQKSWFSSLVDSSSVYLEKYKLSLPTSSRLILPTFASGTTSSVSSSNAATPTGSSKHISDSQASQEALDTASKESQ
ncbi:hypothetical protein Ciccas_010072 [Cichlidogyrus casuarinus]|uniref:Uncharacterized protein n=1 Tax=Cichlidogyrus casuarinus TaxID=1844966 RepID=A0ABD2PV82_9PLAT